MSVDPFANTTTVKNILQHVISPKIVSNGASGYVTRTDLVNVHNLVFDSAGTDLGTADAPNTAQCGTFDTTVYGGARFTVFHSRVTTSSIIFAQVQVCSSTIAMVSQVVCLVNGQFEIFLTTTDAVSIAWFIAKF